jgi:hypothetical protein
MHLRALVNSVIAMTLSGAAWIEATAQAQAPPAEPTAIASLQSYLRETLKKPDYGSFGAQEKQLLVILASFAAAIVDSERCADPSASGSAAESYIFMMGMLRRRSPTVLEVPKKTELVDLAMDLESKRGPARDLTGALCHGRVLSDSTEGHSPSGAPRRGRSLS